MSRAISDGTYTRSDINFNGAVGTALVPGFGTSTDAASLTDEIWAITWFGSNFGRLRLYIMWWFISKEQLMSKRRELPPCFIER